MRVSPAVQAIVKNPTSLENHLKKKLGKRGPLFRDANPCSLHHNFCTNIAVEEI